MAYSNITTHQRIVSGFILLLAFIQFIQLPAARSVDTNPGTIKVKSPSSPEPAKPQAPAPAAPAPAPQTSAPPPTTSTPPRWQGRSPRTNWRAPAPKPKPIPKIYGCSTQGQVSDLPPNLEIGAPVECVINSASLVRGDIREHEYLLDVAEGDKVLLKLSFDRSITLGAYPSLQINGSNGTSKIVKGFNKQRAARYALDVPYDGKLKLLVSAKLYGVGIDLARGEANEDLIVNSVKTGSPASLMGVKRGDLLLSINKRPTKGMSVEEAINLLRGQEGSKVSFGLRRKDGSLSVLIPRVNLEVNESLDYPYTLTADLVSKRKVKPPMPVQTEPRTAPNSLVTKSPSFPNPYAEIPQTPETTDALRRAVNVARMAAERNHGGLAFYRAAACMYQRGGGNCLSQQNNRGFLFRFQGGPPGWEQLRIAPTTTTQILVAPDGRVILEYRAIPF